MPIRGDWRQSKRILAFMVASLLTASLSHAQDKNTVSNCPGQPKLPVIFQIDCSHLRDAATRQLCRPLQRLQNDLESGKYEGNPKECSIAQTQVEESLYLEDTRLVSMFYLKLPPAKGNSQAERDARFNRMYFVVSSMKPTLKKFLTDHGCGPF